MLSDHVNMLEILDKLYASNRASSSNSELTTIFSKNINRDRIWNDLCTNYNHSSHSSRRWDRVRRFQKFYCTLIAVVNTRLSVLWNIRNQLIILRTTIPITTKDEMSVRESMSATNDVEKSNQHIVTNTTWRGYVEKVGSIKGKVKRYHAYDQIGNSILPTHRVFKVKRDENGHPRKFKA